MFFEDSKELQGLLAQSQKAEAAHQNNPEYKKFIVRYRQIMPQVELQLENEPLTQHARDTHDFLLQRLGIKSVDEIERNTIIKAADDRNNADGVAQATVSLNAVWAQTKEYLKEQAAAVHGPTLIETLSVWLQSS